MKILVQKSNCKFTNNLDSLKNNYDIISTTIDNNIYKLDQTINPDIYILSASKLQNEEMHFCRHTTHKKIFIYNDTSNHISKEANNIFVIDKQSIQNLYNPDRFINLNIPKTIDYVYFLDNDIILPEKLNNMLYPQTKQQILMFNNKSIKHPQNLGLLTEDDKVTILNKAKKFICNNMIYAIEANLCGCEAIDLDMKPININIAEYRTYLKFFEEII